MSERFDARDVIAWTDAKLVGDAAGVRFRSVSIDTRTVEPGALFVAIRGEQHDAHAYVEQALDKGAVGLLVEEGRVDAALARRAPVFEVVATTPALGQLAAGHRRRFDGPLVAVTGSNGKTTTKEIIHAVLSSRGPCLKNRGNLNNEFGLPLTLLEREPEHWAAVVEIGMNHRGEIAPLAAIASPTVAVITNVGTAHIEHLGSREAIAMEKGDLLTGLDADGIAVLNADDARVMSQADRAPGRVLRYARRAEADVRASDVRFVSSGAFAFTLHTPQGSAPVRVAGLSETTVVNALAASATGLAAGLSLEQVARGLGAFAGVAGRMAPMAGDGGRHLIDDTYNANPQSVRAALEALASLKQDGARGVAVLGGMGELGEQSDALHAETGRAVFETGADGLVVLGERAHALADAAEAAGFEPSRVVRCETPEQAAEAARMLARDGDWVLVKGSRAMRMERVIEALRADRDDEVTRKGEH